MLSNALLNFRCVVLKQRPDKTDQLACDGDDGLGRRHAIGQRIKLFVETLLRTPRVRNDGCGLTFLALLQRARGARWIPVVPGRFDEYAARSRVATKSPPNNESRRSLIATRSRNLRLRETTRRVRLRTRRRVSELTRTESCSSGECS